MKSLSIMTQKIKMDLAEEVYTTLCTALDKREWHYDKDEENLVVYFGVNGDDIPMNFIFKVDAERQLVSAMSPLPFEFSEEKRMDGAIATCVASFGLADGSFDYDFSNGMVVFRMTATYRESNLGDGLFQYMINCSSAMVDEFNDTFLAIDKGLLSIDDFLASR